MIRVPSSVRSGPGPSRLEAGEELRRQRSRPAPTARRAARLVVCTLAFASVYPRAASAASDSLHVADTTVVLDEVVVTATRSWERAFRVPFNTKVMRMDAEIRSGVRHSTDALREVPGVLLQKTSTGQGSPFFRGFTGFRSLYLVDGIRLNNSTFREGPNQYWNTVDPEMIERYEIVMGPGSVLYGTDALGGTINALSSGSNSPRPERALETRGDYRVSSAERSHSVHLELGGAGPMRTAWHAGWTGRRFGDLQGGRDVGRQRKTGYDEDGLNVRATWDVAHLGRLSASHQRHRQEDVPRTHVTSFARSFAGTTIGTDRQRDLDQARDLSYLKYESKAVGPFDGASAVVSWHVQTEDEQRLTSSGSARAQGFRVRTGGVSMQLEKQAWVRWVYGGEYYRDDVDSYSSTNTIQGPIADDASYDLAGGYVQAQASPWSSFDLVIGARHTYASANAKKVRDPVTGARVAMRDHWSATTGSMRASMAAGDAVRIFGGASQGFRAPNLSDLTRFDNARTQEFEVPAAGLAPEHALSYEVGLKWLTRRSSGSVAVFYTDVRDLIVRKPTGRMSGANFEVTRANGGDGYVTGVEVEGHHRFDVWRVTAMGSWQYGELDQFPTSAPRLSREPFSRLLPLNGILRVRRCFGETWWIQGEAAGAARQDRVSTGDRLDTSRIPPGGTPGYVVFGVHSGARLGAHYQLNLRLENLLDEDYRIHGSGTNEPGRNLVLAVEAAL